MRSNQREVSFVMLEYAKLIGHKCANPSLARPNLWEDADSDEQEVFDLIEEFLRTRLAPNSGADGQSHISQVPEADLEGLVFENLYPVWQKFCNCLGLYFQDDRDDGDALDLNDAIQTTF